MSVEYRIGDLFSQGITALGHGVNCQGLMGAGIAPEFRRRWPAMFEAYRQQCQAGRLRPGGLFAWSGPDGMTVLNLATQDRPGRHATLDAVHRSVAAAVKYCERHQIDQFAIPRLGAGIGGLDWADVSAMVEHAAALSPVRVVAMSLPGAGPRLARAGSAVEPEATLF